MIVMMENIDQLSPATHDRSCGNCKQFHPISGGFYGICDSPVQDIERIHLIYAHTVVCCFHEERTDHEENH